MNGERNLVQLAAMPEERLRALLPAYKHVDTSAYASPPRASVALALVCADALTSTRLQPLGDDDRHIHNLAATVGILNCEYGAVRLDLAHQAWVIWEVGAPECVLVCEDEDGFWDDQPVPVDELPDRLRETQARP